jgi:hypothetical protein
MRSDHFISSFLYSTRQPISPDAAREERTIAAQHRDLIRFVPGTRRGWANIAATDCRRVVRRPLSQIGNCATASLSQIKELQRRPEHGT